MYLEINFNLSNIFYLPKPQTHREKEKQAKAANYQTILEDSKRQEMRRPLFLHLYREKNDRILAKLSAYTYLYFCLLENEAAPQQKSFISPLQLVSSNNNQESQTHLSRDLQNNISLQS